MASDDWMGLAKACLSPGDYLLWKTGFIEFCQENLAHGLHIPADMLMGRGHFDPPQAYQQIAIPGTRAWQELPMKGEKTSELTSILQGPNEPYQEFVACLLQNVGRIVVNAETGNILVKQLATKDANKACKTALQPYRKSYSANPLLPIYRG
jgi:hypothetical protein